MIHVPLWVKIAAGLALAVGVSAGVASCFARPEKRVVATTEKRAETTVNAREETLKKQNRELQQRLFEAAQRDRQSNIRTTETITRFAPGGQPVVYVGGPQGAPGMAPAGAGPQPIEIVVRTSEDLSTERESTSRTGETTDRSSAESTRKASSETTKVEAEKSRTETTTKGTGDSGGGSRLGVGIASNARPVVTYDLIHKNLALGPIKIGQAGAGVFVSGPRLTELSGFDVKRDLDYGPQANVGTGKVFGFVGYGVRRKEALAGVGFRF